MVAGCVCLFRRIIWYEYVVVQKNCTALGVCGSKELIILIYCQTSDIKLVQIRRSSIIYYCYMIAVSARMYACIAAASLVTATEKPLDLIRSLRRTNRLPLFVIVFSISVFPSDGPIIWAPLLCGSRCRRDALRAVRLCAITEDVKTKMEAEPGRKSGIELMNRH